MNPKQSKPRKRHLPQAIVGAFCLLATLMILAGPATTQTERKVHIGMEISLVCNGSNPKSSASFPFKVADALLDNQLLFARTAQQVSAGRHSLRVTARPPNGQEGSWIIKKIEYLRDPLSVVEKFEPNQPTANVPLLIPDEDGAKISITIETCVPQDQVHVQIATTQSCSGAENEPFSSAAGVSVNIGGNTYTSNEKGVIDVFLPRGTYPVGATWKDYALGFVRQNNGVKAKGGESGSPSVTLSGKTEMLEVRMLTCDSAGREKARAVITEMGGSIKVTRSRAEGYAYVGMQLRDGDVVTINGHAKLKWLRGNGEISFDPTTRGASSIVVISPDMPAGAQAPSSQTIREGRLEILRGIGNFFFPPGEAEYDEKGNVIKFKASTRDIKISIKGTAFTFGFDDQSQKSVLDVTQGTVYVEPISSPRRPFDVVADQRVEASSTGVNGPTRSPTQDGAGDLESDTNRLGSDYRDYDLPQDDPGTCRSDCEKDPTCRAFTYVKPNGPRAKGHCWLKSDAPAAKSDSCCISGIKKGGVTAGALEVNTNRLGGDYRDYKLQEANPNQCRQDCENDPKCKAFTYLRPSYRGPDAHCFLKDRVPPPTQNSCCLSGVKSGSDNSGGGGGGNNGGGTTGDGGSGGGPQEQTVNIEVPANRAWTPTGVTLRDGDQVMVQASGYIEAAPASVQGPFYHAVPPGGRAQFHPEKPQPFMPALSMLGRIANGPVVSVGVFSRWYAGGLYGNGELMLGINDDVVDDNSGSWQVKITVFRSVSQPKPPTGGTGGGTGGGTSGAEPIDWNKNAESKGCHPGQRYTYSCPAGGQSNGGIYGFDVYSTDSPICPAAVQAGVITTEKGGTVTIEMVESPGGFGSGTRNGVGSSSGGQRGPCAYKFVGAGTESGGGTGRGSQSQKALLAGTSTKQTTGLTDTTPKVGASRAPNKKPPVVEEIPDDIDLELDNKGRTASSKPTSKNAKPKIEIPYDPKIDINVEEIPDDHVTTTTKTKPAKTTKPNQPAPRDRQGVVEDIPEVEVVKKPTPRDNGATAENKTKTPNQPTVQKQTGSGNGGGFLELVRVEKTGRGACGKDGYTCDPKAGKIEWNNGNESATWSWSLPPPRISPAGFHLTIRVEAQANNTSASSEVQTNLKKSLENTFIEFYSRGYKSGSDEKTVILTPPANLSPGSEFWIEVGAKFIMGYRYYYKVVK